MDIVSWNVNSVRARENRILNWLDQERPDVLCLQELKCTEEQFPFDGFDALGYEVAVSGQKAYNGVGIASLAPIEEVETDLPWSGDAQARGIAARIGGVRVVNLYVPNGSTVGSDKWHYKLEWLDQLARWLAAQDLSAELVACGDYNIAPGDIDCSEPERWADTVLGAPPARERFQTLLGLGLHDALRTLRPDAREWTWWDFRSSMFERGEGLRIDHHLVTERLLARCADVVIDVAERAGNKPSDHAPVTLRLS